jgi:hypothetical protein
MRWAMLGFLPPGSTCSVLKERGRPLRQKSIGLTSGELPGLWGRRSRRDDRPPAPRSTSFEPGVLLLGEVSPVSGAFGPVC